MAVTSSNSPPWQIPCILLTNTAGLLAKATKEDVIEALKPAHGFPAKAFSSDDTVPESDLERKNIITATQPISPSGLEYTAEQLFNRLTGNGLNYCYVTLRFEECNPKEIKFVAAFAYSKANPVPMFYT